MTDANAPPEPPKGCGVCPICQRVWSLSFLPSHVETCLTKGDTHAAAAASASGSAVAKSGSAGAKRTSLHGKNSAPALHGNSSAALHGNSSASLHGNNGNNAFGSSHGGHAGSVSMTPGGAVDLTADSEPVRAARVVQLPQPPPKLCFNIMKDGVVRKKLVDLGLSGDGDKKVCAPCGRSLSVLCGPYRRPSCSDSELEIGGWRKPVLFRSEKASTEESAHRRTDGITASRCNRINFLCDVVTLKGL